MTYAELTLIQRQILEILRSHTAAQPLTRYPHMSAHELYSALLTNADPSQSSPDLSPRFIEAQLEQLLLQPITLTGAPIPPFTPPDTTGTVRRFTGHALHDWFLDTEPAP